MAERWLIKTTGYSEPTFSCLDRPNARKVSISEEMIFLHLVARSKAGVCRLACCLPEGTVEYVEVAQVTRMWV